MRVILASLLLCVMSSATAQADWTESLSFKGDVRLRTEGIKDRLQDQRWRQRVRARLQVEARVNEDISAHIRLATGATVGSKDTLASTNITNSNFGDNKAFNLDRAYVSWKLYDGLKFQGGKLKNKFLRIGGSDILWDGDWTPEGGHFLYKHDMGQAQLFSTFGGYFLVEDKAGEEASVLGGQAGIKFGETVKFTIGGGYYQMNTEGFAVDDAFSKTTTNGNSISAQNEYLYNYNVAEAFMAAQFNLGLPMGVYVNYANNSDAEVQRDALYVAASIGKVKEVGDFRVRVAYRMIKKDAVLGVLNDSDFNAGNTDGTGYSIQGDFRFKENSTLGMRYIKSAQGVSTGDDDNYERYMLDLAFKF